MQARRLLSYILALVMVVSLTLAFSSDLARADDNTYTVRPGDNLTSIAAHYGITVQALAQVNGIANVNNIYAGQVLKLPSANASSTPAPVTTGEQAYLVQPGDTLTGIAARYGIGVYDLASANHLSVMSYIYVGQTLRVPQSGAKPAVPVVTATTAPAATATPTPLPVATTLAAASVPANGSKYTVQHGDTLSSIATHFNVSVDAIVQANHLSDPSLIFGGDVLVIPSSNSSNAPAAVTTTLAAPQAAPASQPVTSGKWIDVNLSKQLLVAYEGSTPVLTSLVSTGISIHPTVVGTFNIYVKYNSQAMSGPGYYLPGVPYVMYFYSAYALHGTYWHHNFGHPMSHGCVNLPTDKAQWLYNWAPIGTPVHVHY